METTPLIPRPPRKSIWSWLRCCVWPYFGKQRKATPRAIRLGFLPDDYFPPNIISNQKYSALTFLPLVLFQQFRFFLNLYFLLMAFTQFIPEIRIGYLSTYWGPLTFVISVSVIREAIDDINRFRRDREVNTQQYLRLQLSGPGQGRLESVSARELRVGDVVALKRRQRVPADMLLLRGIDASGAVFVATDQLDGETDWKVRLAVPSTQHLKCDSELLGVSATVFAEKPQPDIHSFIGMWNSYSGEVVELSVQHTLWSGFVLESAHATGLVLYTGPETRSVMNNSMPRSKVGKLDLILNNLTKVLFVLMILLSCFMIGLKGFSGPWLRYLCRFFLLFSYIIPISLRVNLELGKNFYAWAIKWDKHISGTVMRSTTIPEEMGRVSYLLTDKTGTVTKNEMVFKKLNLGEVSYNERNFHEVQTLLTQHATKESQSLPMTPTDSFSAMMAEPLLSINQPLLPMVTSRRIWDTVLAMALCHNVTPVYDKDSLDFAGGPSWDDDMADTSSSMSESRGGAVPQQQLCDYQAASPDEVALVKWTDTMGVSLYKRDLTSISLKVRATNEVMNFSILQMFPFTSESKCMGIIVQDNDTSEITFYLKGADIVLCPLVGSPAWLTDQSDLLANEGLRTLVFAKKRLSQQEYQQFRTDYDEALSSLHGRAERLESCVRSLQRSLVFLAITGVEDRLANDAPATIELLINAGIKIWMLTGDKLETALCISKSLRLVGPRVGGGSVFIFSPGTSRVEVHAELERLKHEGAGQALLISGDSLDRCLHWYCAEVALLTLRCSTVVVARCSPTQKASVVELLRCHAKGSICAVGDGGNDVPMIQQADIGVGIEGKEGLAAALASDVSTREFCNLGRLLLVHGRRARLRSSTLSLFVVHRGLIISTMQAIFSTVFYLSSVSLYQGPLMIGYGTVFTSIPVFSLVLDKDISSEEALLNPHLYKTLVKGRDLSYKIFCMWIGISVYQGGIIMYGALVMFEDEFIHIVAISFSALIFTELVMVALTIQTWHWLIVLAEVFSVIVYILALIIFHEYFDAEFIRTVNFMWKVLVITLVACLPLYILMIIHKKYSVRKQAKITS